ncbi:MAG: hypothetical protein CM15mP49_12340 [Actinomycetota bacterium]|nr:MAG: hypothetical protein CM15mP49_12340 [Actinomycetota bacterium]
MALACDMILAGESARFDSRFLEIGIHPGGGHTWRLLSRTNEQTMRNGFVWTSIVQPRSS